ncbi:cache domain-containing protein [Undibacterium sp. TJN25]|uniref:cache domain-containing protein n=1 Tax=Undibacterium sp. TJN25 TaxID=3413056 RepID=UPI003BF21FDB
MKFFKLMLSAACFIFSVSALAAGKADDAVAIVDKGLAYLQKNGKEALIREVNNKNPAFIRGDVYLALRALDGTTLAHPINPRVVGKNMMVFPDADGKYYRKEIVEIAKSKGKGWVSYRYSNPDSNELEDKATYFVRSGDMILEAGIYKPK